MLHKENLSRHYQLHTALNFMHLNAKYDADGWWGGSAAPGTERLRRHKAFAKESSHAFLAIFSSIHTSDATPNGARTLR